MIDLLTLGAGVAVPRPRRGVAAVVSAGSNRGRTVRVWGITISRLRDGRIVEDWSAFDSIELLRQLGLRRAAVSAPRLLAALRSARRTG